MKASDIDTSEVHFKQDGTYLVRVKINNPTGKVVSATFDVGLYRRGQKHGYKHHRKSYENIDEEARKALASFGRELAKILEPTSPH